MTCTWNVMCESIILSKSDGTQMHLKIGDFIKFEKTQGIRIESFTGNDPKGPIGMIYLPWRGDRWATPQFSMNGDPRHIICWPMGLPHYGLHHSWNTVEFVNGGICPI